MRPSKAISPKYSRLDSFAAQATSYLPKILLHACRDMKHDLYSFGYARKFLPAIPFVGGTSRKFPSASASDVDDVTERGGGLRKIPTSEVYMVGGGLGKISTL